MGIASTWRIFDGEGRGVTDIYQAHIVIMVRKLCISGVAVLVLAAVAAAAVGSLYMHTIWWISTDGFEYTFLLIHQYPHPEVVNDVRPNNVTYTMIFHLSDKHVTPSFLTQFQIFELF